MAVTKAELLSSLPRVIDEDRIGHGLASAAALVQEGREQEIRKAILYPAIDDMDGELLDIIAADFRVEWWEFAETLEQKRALMKQTWYIWKHIGTPAAVEAAVGALYPGTSVSEWFDYEGEPYHFRIAIPVPYTETGNIRYSDTVRLVEFFKNLRSVLDYAEYISDYPEFQPVLHADSRFGRGLMITEIPEVPCDFNPNLYWGTNGAMFASTVLEGAFRWERFRILGSGRAPAGYVSSGVENCYPFDGLRYVGGTQAAIRDAVLEVGEGEYTVTIQQNVLEIAGDIFSARIGRQNLAVEFRDGVSDGYWYRIVPYASVAEGIFSIASAQQTASVTNGTLSVGGVFADVDSGVLTFEYEEEEA